jgi:hypothetical protein
MVRVSLFVELLRSRPAVVVLLAVLAQTLLWWLVPSLLYSAPPGDLPVVLAVGHEFQLGTYLGPPFAFWLGDLAYSIGGMTAVYLLSQICVGVAFWAVFNLARGIVGVAHAAMAVLLMVGIFVFTLPTPEFGPTVAAMPLTALVMFHFWRAIGLGKQRYWFAVAIEIGLLLLTSYAGLIICALLILITAFSKRGRAALNSVDPWIAGIVIAVMMFPHLLWLDAAGDVLMPALYRLGAREAANANMIAWVKILFAVLAAHAGLGLLVALARGWSRLEHGQAPVFVRGDIDRFARRYIYSLAILPILVAGIIAVFLGESGPVGGMAPLVLLSGLAIVVAAGKVIGLYRQRMLALVWVVLLLLPPAVTATAVVALPWLAGTEMAVGQPADTMGRFFAETFQRRTGRPLEIVSGDLRLAAVVSLKAPSRPMLYFFATPERSPWTSLDDIRRRGAIIFWTATDTAGTPPPAIRAVFPELVPEVPRAFERSVQGRAPLLRVGWGMIRPSGTATP